MAESPKKLLDSQDTAVCVKEPEGKVVYQNETCLSLCGPQKGNVCETGCMALRNAKQRGEFSDEGVMYFPNQEVNGRACDIITVKDQSSLTTIIYKKESLVKKRMQTVASYGLSRRESEIARLILMGKSNEEICKCLFISRPTLKTHLNHIYHKLPEQLANIFRTRDI